MNTTFSEMIDRLTATTPEQEDYTGEDGLLYLSLIHISFFPTTPDISATVPEYMGKSMPRLRNM